MFKEIQTKLAKKSYPERNINVPIGGDSLHQYDTDTIAYNKYVLDGTYSYDEVVKLNELTTCNAYYGFCDELGPIAIIGITNPRTIQRNVYFMYKVCAYGTAFDESEVYLKKYTEDEAKKRTVN